MMLSLHHNTTPMVVVLRQHSLADMEPLANAKIADSLMFLPPLLLPTTLPYNPPLLHHLPPPWFLVGLGIIARLPIADSIMMMKSFHQRKKRGLMRFWT